MILLLRHAWLRCGQSRHCRQMSAQNYICVPINSWKYKMGTY
ncbi:hypothetical protein ANT2_2129 [plant metagenome]|uniref:Uncharacterized protein n=1 Tax=plant metagenome TaxID=1297885 RepID=A0A484RG28_9ZZZZ